MNIYQKIVIAAGAVLAALRLFFPVRYTEVLGMRFAASKDTNLFQNVDWSQTGLHIGGIIIVTVALVFIFKKAK
jgi:hypothetical protein